MQSALFYHYYYVKERIIAGNGEIYSTKRPGGAFKIIQG